MKNLREKHLFSQQFWKEKEGNLKGKFKRWSLATGIDVKEFNLRLAVALGDKLQIRRIHDASIPSELSKKDIEEIMALWQWALKKQAQVEEISNFMLEDLLIDITSYLQEASFQKSPLKYVLFSDHCETIMGIMSILRKPLEEVSPYVANLNFSLFKTDAGDHIVKIGYNDRPVIVPGCNNRVCTLERFVKLFDINNQQEPSGLLERLKVLLKTKWMK